jgi:hypothetical protein
VTTYGDFGLELEHNCRNTSLVVLVDLCVVPTSIAL